MPLLYSHLRSYIINVILKEKEMAQISRTNNNPTNSGKNQHTHQKYNHQQHKKKYFDQKPSASIDQGFESAMISTATNVHPASQKTVNVPPGHTLVSSTVVKQFDRPVGPQEKFVMIVKNNKLVSYTATKEKCLLCTDSDTAKHHPIRCYRFAR
jgi:hypothetical protein